MENYQVKSSEGTVLLSAETKDSFYFKGTSKKDSEIVYVKDYFTVFEGAETDDYTLDIVIENPLLGKETTLTKKFSVEPEFYVKPEAEE